MLEVNLLGVSFEERKAQTLILERFLHYLDKVWTSVPLRPGQSDRDPLGFCIFPESVCKRGSRRPFPACSVPLSSPSGGFASRAAPDRAFPGSHPVTAPMAPNCSFLLFQ